VAGERGGATWGDRVAALGLLIAQAGDPEVNAQAANQPVSGAAILWRSALSVEAEGRVGVKGTEEDSRKQQERGPRQRAYNSSYPGIVVAGGDSMNAETRQVRACGGVAGRGGPLGLIALCVVLLSGLAWGCFGSPATTLDFAASVREGNFPLAVGFTSTVPGNSKNSSSPSTRPGPTSCRRRSKRDRPRRPKAPDGLPKAHAIKAGSPPAFSRSLCHRGMPRFAT